MPRVRTHYDNLKVSRDAPIEVIHAAFKILAAKYQPRVTAGDTDAVRIAMIVSRSYAVLSDAAQRAEHDKWIAASETPETEFHPEPRTPLLQRSWFQVALGLCVLCFVCVGLFVFTDSGVPASSPVSTAAPAIPAAAPVPIVANAPPLHPVEPQVLVPKETPILVARPSYTRRALAPNGEPWPTVSSYFIDQVEDGNSLVVVDNTGTGSDMVVELYDRSLQPAANVRAIFLLKHEQFTLKGVRAGSYDIRYLNLDSGVRRKSEPFSLEDHREEKYIRKEDGLHHMVRTGGDEYELTLYTTFDGNTQSQIIGPDEFDSSFLPRLPRQKAR